MESLGRNFPHGLKHSRQRMLHSQQDVAFILRLKSANRISDWERGKKYPGFINLLKLYLVYREMIDVLYPDLIQELRQDILLREEELREMKLKMIERK
ncbi:MAG: hypothetical protein RL641_255 [Candidatus Parcubacteria bacterium]|jgi:transcriptional regulator with XRE-family HTH domain